MAVAYQKTPQGQIIGADGNPSQKAPVVQSMLNFECLPRG
jgi:hypothetical protein